MPTEQIIGLLVAERDRLNRAIEALQGGLKRRGRPPKSSAAAASAAVPVAAAAGVANRTRKPMSPAQKKAHSERMKAFWAQRRKDAKKG
jgi:hypothetical protein